MADTGDLCFPNQLEYYDWLEYRNAINAENGNLPSTTSDHKFDELSNIITSPRVGILPVPDLTTTDPDYYMYAQDVIDMQIQENNRKRLNAERLQRQSEKLEKQKKLSEIREAKLKSKTEKETEENDKKVLKTIARLSEKRRKEIEKNATTKQFKRMQTIAKNNSKKNKKK